MYFHVYSFKLQIHAHIYRSFIRHHKMLGVRIAKRTIEPQKPANPCGTKLCARIFFANTLHVRASFISFAPTFFKKSECTHSAAPPFQAANAPLVCGLMRWGFGLVHLFRQHSSKTVSNVSSETVFSIWSAIP